jgi:hypothetical protein
MAWVDLEVGILEDFASFAHIAHDAEWKRLAHHESRAETAVARETLGIRDAISELREAMLAPDVTRGLAVDDLLEKRNEFLRASAEKEWSLRRDKSRKIATSAIASRRWYERAVNDQNRYEQRLAEKRASRRERKHGRQGELI